jgi:hypothetical protein
MSAITTTSEERSMLEDIITLAEAAAELGIASVTLRAAVGRGRLRARLIGKTWVTTRDEVERYRRESLGQPGRPPRASATHPVPKGRATHPVPRITGVTHVDD